MKLHCGFIISGLFFLFVKDIYDYSLARNGHIRDDCQLPSSLSCMFQPVVVNWKYSSATSCDLPSDELLSSWVLSPSFVRWLPNEPDFSWDLSFEWLQIRIPVFHCANELQKRIIEKKKRGMISLSVHEIHRFCKYLVFLSLKNKLKKLFYCTCWRIWLSSLKNIFNFKDR